MAQAQHERPSSVDMGDGDCGLKEGSAASPRSAAVVKDVTDIVDIKKRKKGVGAGAGGCPWGLGGGPQL